MIFCADSLIAQSCDKADSKCLSYMKVVAVSSSHVLAVPVGGVRLLPAIAKNGSVE